MSQPDALPLYPWFLPVWQQWCALAQQQRLGQGLLLTGLVGIGVADCAQALGRYLLCENPQQQAPCGRCKGCLLLQANTHPDLLEVYPEEGSSLIKVDQVRAIGDFVATTAQLAGRKLVVIHPAEALHTHAANALLKNLEEPVGQTFFILASCHPARLLPTIRSRCTQWHLPAPSAQQATDWLRAQGVEAPEQALAQANGAPLRVLDWQKNNHWQAIVQLAETLQQGLMGAVAYAQMAKICTSFGAGPFVERMLIWVQRSQQLPFLPANGLCPPFAIEQLLSQCPAMALQGFYDSLLKKRAGQMVNANANPALVVDDILIELLALVRKRGQQR